MEERMTFRDALDVMTKCAILNSLSHHMHHKSIEAASIIHDVCRFKRGMNHTEMLDFVGRKTGIGMNEFDGMLAEYKEEIHGRPRLWLEGSFGLGDR